MDITDHYELVSDGRLFNTLEEARVVSGFNDDKIWFVRHGEGPDPEDPNAEELWDVELNFGQYVNKAGYFVSVEPCKPEHRHKIFTY